MALFKKPSPENKNPAEAFGVADAYNKLVEALSTQIDYHNQLIKVLVQQISAINQKLQERPTKLEEQFKNDKGQDKTVDELLADVKQRVAELQKMDADYQKNIHVCKGFHPLFTMHKEKRDKANQLRQKIYNDMQAFIKTICKEKKDKDTFNESIINKDFAKFDEKGMLMLGNQFTLQFKIADFNLALSEITKLFPSQNVTRLTSLRSALLDLKKTEDQIPDFQKLIQDAQREAENLAKKDDENAVTFLQPVMGRLGIVDNKLAIPNRVQQVEAKAEVKADVVIPHEPTAKGAAAQEAKDKTDKDYFEGLEKVKALLLKEKKELNQQGLDVTPIIENINMASPVSKKFQSFASSIEKLLKDPKYDKIQLLLDIRAAINTSRDIKSFDKAMDKHFPQKGFTP